jgi:hypothetical protein
MVLINPSEIYFTHSKINQRFSGCRKLLSDTLNELIQDITKIKIIPKIKVFYVKHQNGIIKYYSENNRRLWVFKKLYQLGLIETIDVRLEESHNPNYLKNTYSLEAKIKY